MSVRNFILDLNFILLAKRVGVACVFVNVGGNYMWFPC